MMSSIGQDRDESGCQGKTIRQLALLDHMVIDEDGKLYHTHWPQGKTATKGILLQCLSYLFLKYF